MSRCALSRLCKVRDKPLLYKRGSKGTNGQSSSSDSKTAAKYEITTDIAQGTYGSSPCSASSSLRALLFTASVNFQLAVHKVILGERCVCMCICMCVCACVCARMRVVVLRSSGMTLKDFEASCCKLYSLFRLHHLRHGRSLRVHQMRVYGAEFARGRETRRKRRSKRDLSGKHSERGATETTGTISPGYMYAVPLLVCKKHSAGAGRV